MLSKLQQQPARQWSALQLAIFDAVSNTKDNYIIEAVAGSGKSTTIVEAIKRVRGSSIFLAFNKAIAEELKKKGVNARTFHSLCYNPVLLHKMAQTVTADKLKPLLMKKISGEDFAMYGSFACKLVDLARQAGIGCLVPDEPRSWFDICNHYDIEPENEDASLHRGIEIAQDLLQWSNESPQIDFSDLLYLAVKNGTTLPKFDFVFVDEAQDTNAIQRAILRKILKPGGRIVAVGDPAQAIYGFRGADSDSLGMIASEFNCKSLPLSISYRCPTKVVEYAQQWVSHIQASPEAPEGEVVDFGTKWKIDMMQAGDLVVCRRSAPIMVLAYSMLRERKPVTIMGRDLGMGLVSTIKKMNAKGIEQLISKLEAFKEREVEKAVAKSDEGKAESIKDRVDAILCLIDGMPETNRTIPALIAVIEDLFKDKANAVILATIHKSKGLEANRVWWLERSMCPAKWARLDWEKQQELNLCYVAATRAKQSLFCIEN